MGSAIAASSGPLVFAVLEVLIYIYINIYVQVESKVATFLYEPQMQLEAPSHGLLLHGS